MRPWHWRLIVAAIVVTLGAPLLAPPVAAADKQPDYAAIYARAEEHRKAGRLLEAAKDYDRVHALEPSEVLLYNAGRMYHQAGSLELAAARYRTFLAHNKAPGPRRERVVAELAAVERRLAEQKAETVATTALERVRQADLARERQASQESALSEADRLEVASIAGFGLAGAALIASVALGAYGETQASSLASPPRWPDGTIRWTEEQTKARADEVDDLRLAAGIVGGLGAALAISGIVMWFVAADRRNEAAQLSVGFGTPGGSSGVAGTLTTRF